jgi:uncharacterized protein YheU (UPF0270 family)
MLISMLSPYFTFTCGSSAPKKRLRKRYLHPDGQGNLVDEFVLRQHRQAAAWEAEIEKKKATMRRKGNASRVNYKEMDGGDYL